MCDIIFTNSCNCIIIGADVNEQFLQNKWGNEIH